MKAEDIWAKSPLKHQDRGESLAAHTARALTNLNQLRKRCPQLAKIAQMPRFWERMILVVLFHDLGKCAEGFQRMLRGGPIFSHRHEILSCAFLPYLFSRDPHDDFSWIASGVLSHHKDLSKLQELYPCAPPVIALPDGLETALRDIEPSFFQQGIGYLRSFLMPLLPASIEVFRSEELTADDLRRMAQANIRRAIDAYSGLSAHIAKRNVTDPLVLAGQLLRGSVILADHSSSAGQEFLFLEALEDPFEMLLTLNRTAESLYYHQREAGNTCGSALLAAPTGSGKTEAALLWAARNVQKPGNTPIFYVLPYQASLNAMRYRLGDVFGKDAVALQHSRALQAVYQQLLDKKYKPEDAIRMATLERSAGKLHVRPFRILTPYQLLRGAFQLPGHEALVTDCAYGRMIIDEMHAYEPGRFGQILAMVGYLAENFGVQVLAMSATMPKIMRAAWQRALKLSENKNLVVADSATFEKFQRHRLHICRHDLRSEQVIEKIKTATQKGFAVLVVATTVKRAQLIFDHLKNVLPSEIPIELLHGKFCPRDRSKKELELQKSCSVGAVRKQPHPIILVATQVVEVSLNVDFDILFSDPAPLEALLQRFGRINRLHRESERDVVVCTQIPGGCPVYDLKLLEATIKVIEGLNGVLIDESLVTSELNAVYAGEIGDNWMARVERAEGDFRDRVLASLRPFQSDPGVQELFEKMFDGEEVLPESLKSEYIKQNEEDPILGPQLMVPVTRGQLMRLFAEKRICKLPDSTLVARAAYSFERGLDPNLEYLMDGI